MFNTYASFTHTCTESRRSQVDLSSRTGHPPIDRQTVGPVKFHPMPSEAPFLAVIWNSIIAVNAYRCYCRVIWYIYILVKFCGSRSQLTLLQWIASLVEKSRARPCRTVPSCSHTIDGNFCRSTKQQLMEQYLSS